MSFGECPICQAHPLQNCSCDGFDIVGSPKSFTHQGRLEVFNHHMYDLIKRKDEEIKKLTEALVEIGKECPILFPEKNRKTHLFVESTNRRQELALKALGEFYARSSETYILHR